MDKLQHQHNDTYRLREGAGKTLSSAGFIDHDAQRGASLKLASPKPGTGRVFLTGAGPNDPELLTVKAMKAIQNADAIVYDRLVNVDILDLAKPSATLIYVGKRCGKPSLKQEEISQILVDLAMQGLEVVRLKGGDPFIFGRGGEEGLRLAEQGIEYEVIPGITAAIGCAASSFIPLTHREVARSVTFVTGQVVSGALPTWAHLVGQGQTLVFYMGLEKSADIQQGLMANGLAADFPLAIVTHGCSRQQQVHISTLGALCEMAQGLKGVSPTLIILGEVVKLREQLTKTIASVAYEAV